MGEAGREGGQEDPLARPGRLRLHLVRQVLGPVHRLNGLAGPAPDKDRAIVVQEAILRCSG